jgi:tetratricopeptide (TPR) repeat protein
MIEALKGDAGAIEEIITLVQQLNESDADALLMAVDYYSDRKDFAKALPLAEKAHQLETGYLTAQVAHAYAQYGSGVKQQAMETLDSLLTVDQDNARTNYTLSKILVQEGIDLPRASNLARRAVFSSFMGYDEWMNLCHAYYRSDRLDLCRGEASKASRKFEDRPGPYFWMGMVQHREKDQGAKGNLQKAIDLGLTGDELTQAREILAKL